MGDVYAVLSDSADGAEDALKRLCEALELEPLGKVMQSYGPFGRWMARAQPAGVQRGQVQPGFTCTQPNEAS